MGILREIADILRTIVGTLRTRGNHRNPRETQKPIGKLNTIFATNGEILETIIDFVKKTWKPRTHTEWKS